MKQILILSLIVSYSYGQSTLLTPGKAEVNTNQIVIGNVTNSIDSLRGKLVVLGRKNLSSNVSGGAFFSSLFPTDEISSASGIISEFKSSNASIISPLIKINIPYKSIFGNFGVDIDFGELIGTHTGIRINSVSESSPILQKTGVRTNLLNYTNSGNLLGNEILLSNNANSGTMTGSSVSMSSGDNSFVTLKGNKVFMSVSSNCDCQGQVVNISRYSQSTGIAKGFVYNINGADNSNIGQNIGGTISSTVTGAEKNIGLEITATGAIAENTGLKVTAGGTSISRAAIFNGKIENNGFTRLGTAAPFIQQKEIEVPDNTPIGNFTIVNHAIGNIDKIVSMDVKIYTNSNVYVHENYPSPFRFAYSYDANNITIYNIPSESSGITGTGRKIKVLITYKE